MEPSAVPGSHEGGILPLFSGFFSFRGLTFLIVCSIMKYAVVVYYKLFLIE